MIEEVLTPSYHGEQCRHNGNNPDYEIACDECDYYLMCFPDWKDIMEQYDADDQRLDSISTSPDEALEAFLRANAMNNGYSKEIEILVIEELARRERARKQIAIQI